MGGDRMQDYRELDDAICAHLEAGGGSPGLDSLLQSMARKLTDARGNRLPAGIDLHAAERLIDRRMQAMRKIGRLEYVGRKAGDSGWRVVRKHAQQEAAHG